jgi:dTDP-4-amino-4,6-dideoxygalactose transaminase
MTKIDFIENKHIDFKKINKIYDISRQANHHANFGPVSKLLENFFAKKLKLPKNKRVICCSSATSAMLIIAKYLISKKKLDLLLQIFRFSQTTLMI